MARKGRAFQWQIYPAFYGSRFKIWDNIVNINIYINDIIHRLNDIPIIDDMSDNTIFLKKYDVLVRDNNKN